jgi:hypothetical protein
MLEIGGWQIGPALVVVVLVLAGAIAGLGALAKRFRIAGYAMAALPAVVGIWVGISALLEPNGYIASYSVGAAWLFAGLIGISSGLVILIPKLRRVGLLGCGGTVVLLACFYAVVLLGNFFGLARWTELKQVPIGPDVPADLVIIFARTATDREIEQFWRSQLSTRAEKGYELKLGIQEVLRVQVHQHAGIAVTFSPGAKPEEKAAIRSEAVQSSLVRDVFEEIAPNQIILDDP